MLTPLIKQMNDAIIEFNSWQGFELTGLDVTPDTYESICRYRDYMTMDASRPNTYQGLPINIIEDMSEPFKLTIKALPSNPMTFKFKEVGPNEWQHVDYDFSHGVTEYTKATVNTIQQPNQ